MAQSGRPGRWRHPGQSANPLRDREREDDELSLGRRGDRPLAGRARGLRAGLRPPRRHRAPLPGPPGGRRSRGGAGRRAVPDRVRAAQDVRRVARERAAVAVRDRLESVAEAPARRGPAAARERPDGGSTRRRTGARAPRRSMPACSSRAWPTRSRRCRTASARRSCSSRGRTSRTRAWPRRSSCRSARCARGSTAPARICANYSSRAGKRGRGRDEAGGPGEEAAARGRVRAGGARPGKGSAHGSDPAGGRSPCDDQRSFRGFRTRTSVPRSRSWSVRSGSARSRPRGACAQTARSTTRWSSSATA